MPSKRAAKTSTNLLSLPDDILTYIMNAFEVSLHASPKPLLALLLTTKRLCKPRCKMYKTLVRPFLHEYHAKLVATCGQLLKKIKLCRLRSRGFYDELPAQLQLAKRHEAIEVAKMIAKKVDQLQEYTRLLRPFLGFQQRR